MRAIVWAVPFRHDLEVQPLTNSRGEPVLYRVMSSNIATLAIEQHGGVTSAAHSEMPVIAAHTVGAASA